MTEQQFNAMLEEIKDCCNLLIKDGYNKKWMKKSEKNLERILNKHKDFLCELPQEYAIEEDLAKCTTSSFLHSQSYTRLILAYQYAYNKQFPYDHPYFKVIKRIFELFKEDRNRLDMNLWWIQNYAWFLNLFIKLEEKDPYLLNVISSNIAWCELNEGQPCECRHLDESMTEALFKLITKREALFQYDTTSLNDTTSLIIHAVFFNSLSPMIYVDQLFALDETYPFLSSDLLIRIMTLEWQLRSRFLGYFQEWMTVEQPLSQFLMQLKADQKEWTVNDNLQLLFVEVIRSFLSHEQAVPAKLTRYEYRPDMLALLTDYPYLLEDFLLEPLDILTKLVELAGENPDPSYENQLHLLEKLAEAMNLSKLRIVVGYLNIIYPYCPGLKENREFFSEMVLFPANFANMVELVSEKKITADQVEKIYFKKWHKFSEEQIMEELDEELSTGNLLTEEEIEKEFEAEFEEKQPSASEFPPGPSPAASGSVFFAQVKSRESLLSILKGFLAKGERNIYKSILLEKLDGEDKIFIGDEMIDAFSQEKQPEMNKIIRQHSSFESTAEFLSALKTRPREVISLLTCEQPSKAPQNR